MPVGRHIVFKRSGLIIDICEILSNNDKQLKFEKTGDDPFDFWTVNGHKNWAVLPSTITGFADDLPIRLQVGDGKFGYTHIMERHSRWVMQHSRNSLEGLLWKKLGQAGKVHSDNNNESKRTITMAILPQGILVLRKVRSKDGEFLTVVTLYGSSNFGNIDGYLISRYTGDYRLDPNTKIIDKNEAKPDAKAASKPKIVIKKKRRL